MLDGFALSYPVSAAYHCKASHFLALSHWFGVGRIAFHGIYDGGVSGLSTRFLGGFR